MRTGKVELSEFLAQRRTCDEQDAENSYSDARALARGIRNAFLTVMPFWLGLAWWLAR
jgi:hypothetical protein